MKLDEYGGGIQEKMKLVDIAMTKTHYTHAWNSQIINIIILKTKTQDWLDGSVVKSASVDDLS